MLDFLRIATRPTKSGIIEIFPKFIICKSKDLMIKGRDFYAIYIESKNLWSTDEQDAINVIDTELKKYADEYKKKTGIENVNILYMWDSDSNMINKWHSYCQKQCRDNYKSLNQNILFANNEPKKNDYCTTVLPYALEPGNMDAYDEIISTLYSPEDRHKIEWCIGAIVTGASKTIHKFLVLYGEKGTGKSTIINIIQKLFDGYYTVFDAKSVGTAGKDFALEPFKHNPPLAIQHDGDLSKIDDNTRLNSIVAHERQVINEKNKAMYDLKLIAFLIMGTNNPVKITDSKSGLLRRMIDANPTGDRLPLARYNDLIKKVDFELGHIAYHCKEVYEANPTFYDDYEPLAMMGETNDFFNFVEDNYLIFKSENQLTLKEVWEMYKQYCDDAKVAYPFSMRLVKAELKTYFRMFEEDHYDDNTGQHTKCLYTGFKYEMFEKVPKELKQAIKEQKEESKKLIEFKVQPSKLDEYCKDCPAQYATLEETPKYKWDNVKTTLKDIDTSKLHYLKPDEHLIVIDFDMKNGEGKKDFKLNNEAASKWPETYAELSKSGSGIHLHYIYDGDVSKLSHIYEENIEIKIFSGNSSLRRKVSKCNDKDIAHITSGLPLKGADKVESINVIKTEKQLRTMIIRNLNKEYMGATAPSISFIKKLLDDAYESGMSYDVSDLYNHILQFACNSTNQKDNCLKLVAQMKFKSDDPAPSIETKEDLTKPIAFFDCEVFPNLIVVCYKLAGKNNKCVRLINPTSKDILYLLDHFRLIGFNNRSYDNHIIYAILIGKTTEEIYQISKKIINDEKKEKSMNNGHFGNAYNLSYTDIYDYCSNDNKMSLKKWEIKLGIYHLELGLPWDKPVPKELWEKVARYCCNDVEATEEVFNATQADFTAREILAEIANMTVNDTTNSLTTRIIFGDNRNPVIEYTDLSKEFPGYEFKKEWNDTKGKYDKSNMYRGTDLGLGGYVYAEPGMYRNVALLDVASLHPHSAIALNAFGEYTKRFQDLVDIRVYIKHGDYDSARKMFGGKLVRYLDDENSAKKLSTALKTAINSVYGLSSAAFDNPFRHPDNHNNIIALRGALFMRTLQDEVVKRGFQVIHIKTDSIKIPNATKEIIDFCMDFARQYKYEFEHEATYDRICLVNDAVYIAKYAPVDWCEKEYGYVPEKNHKCGPTWVATGTQFAVPYVFKTCFSKESIVFDDLREIKQVKTAIYLDFNEDLDVSNEELYNKILKTRYDLSNNPETKVTKPMMKILEDYKDVSDTELKEKILDGHRYQFVGKVGCFCPIKPGKGGGTLVAERIKKDGSTGFDSVVGTSDYRWKEAANVKGICEDDIDLGYYNNLADKAIETISNYGDYYAFIAQ